MKDSKFTEEFSKKSMTKAVIKTAVEKFKYKTNSLYKIDKNCDELCQIITRLECYKEIDGKGVARYETYSYDGYKTVMHILIGDEIVGKIFLYKQEYDKTIKPVTCEAVHLNNFNDIY